MRKRKDPPSPSFSKLVSVQTSMWAVGNRTNEAMQGNKSKIEAISKETDDDPFERIRTAATAQEQQNALAAFSKTLATADHPEELVVQLLTTTTTATNNAYEDDDIIDCLFVCKSSVDIMNAALRVLRDSTTPLDLPLAALQHTLFSSRLWNELDSDGLLPTVLTIPSVVAQVCQTRNVPLPDDWGRHAFYEKLLSTVLQQDDSSSWNPQNSPVIWILRHLLRRPAGDKLVARCLWKHRATVDIMFLLVPREFALTSRSMILLALAEKKEEEVKYLVETIGRVLLQNEDHADAFVALTVLSTSSVLVSNRTMDQQFCDMVAELLVSESAEISSSTNDDDDDDEEEEEEEDDEDSLDEIAFDASVPASHRLLGRYMLQVARTWSTAVFVRKTDHTLQHHVTFFLRKGLSLVSQLSVTSPLVEPLMNGVQQRMLLTNPDLRKDGLHVGTLLARSLGQEVEFKELEEQNETIVGNHIAISDTAFHASDKDSVEKADDDSSWGEDSVLEPYQLEDDEEDLRDTPRPRFLSDCIELLQTPESEELAGSGHETVLLEVPALIRSRPLDLPDFAPELAREILRLENKFGITDFVEHTVAALRALLVEEPLSVGTVLIKEVVEESGLVDRLNILEALTEAATELCGVSRWSDERQVSGGGRELAVEAVTKDVDESPSSMISAAVPMKALRTRRRGRSGTVNDQEATPNRFGAIGPTWFYRLVGMFIEHRERKDLWDGGNGAILLSRLFVTLGVIVESCRNTPGVEMLANDLIRLVWSFRGADVADVRASVLFGVATSFPLLRNDVALSLVLDESMESISRGSFVLARNDPDDICRELATFISGSMKALVDSSHGRYLH